MTKFELTRDVTKEECPWLPRDFKAGEIVFEFRGATYGCISPGGIAISLKNGEYPFLEVPRDSIKIVA